MRSLLPMALLLLLVPVGAQTTPQAPAGQTGSQTSGKKSDKTSAKAHTPSSKKAKSHSSAKDRGKTKARSSHADGIAPARASEIESALVKAGYLDHVTGDWDAEAQAAMKRYQKDHHWQEKYAPDSRALIALGLYSGATSAEAVAEAGSGSSGGK